MPFRSYPPRKRAQTGDLFEPTKPDPQAPKDYLVAHVDGGARGNPGPSGYGVFIQDSQKHPVAELSEYLGIQTNNFAEYSGLLAALRYARDNGHKALEIVSDSELMVRQLNGQYKVKSELLKPLYEQARAMIRGLDWFKVRHVRREFNKDADRLANEAMDRKGRPLEPGSGASS
jgi:ribonuclease HI